MTANTRLCVKNVPKHLKNDRFREIFSKFGQVTDAKIVMKYVALFSLCGSFNL